jgi:hypothetical protein
MRVLFALLVTILASQVVAEPRIDASTQANFSQSLEVMKRELPLSKAAELDAAVASRPFAGMQSFKDTPPDGIVKFDIKKLDGMSADQIIELAHKTVSVKIRVGPPPGLPEQYAAPLRGTSGKRNDLIDAQSIAGTAWELTEKFNGFISHQHVILRNGGMMDDGTAGHGHWEQLGAQVKIAFNDNYAVYLGSLEDATSLKGSAANINGSEWTWTGQRSR